MGTDNYSRNFSAGMLGMILPQISSTIFASSCFIMSSFFCGARCILRSRYRYRRVFSGHFFKIARPRARLRVDPRGRDGSVREVLARAKKTPPSEWGDGNGGVVRFPPKTWHVTSPPTEIPCVAATNKCLAQSNKSPHEVP